MLRAPRVFAVFGPPAWVVRPGGLLILSGMTSESMLPVRHLTDRPQRLGILPTWWYWRDRENWRSIAWPFTTFVIALAIVLGYSELPTMVWMPIYVAAYFVALGSVEKYVRVQASKRRLELAQLGHETSEDARD